MYRNDPWGSGLANYTKAALEKLNIDYELIPYPPEATEFTPYVAELAKCVEKFSKIYVS